MSTMTIRNIDDQFKAKLRVRAALNGRSMEEEARSILRAGLAAEPSRSGSLAQAIRDRVALLGGVELELPQRSAIRTPPDLLA